MKKTQKYKRVEVRCLSIYLIYYTSRNETEHLLYKRSRVCVCVWAFNRASVWVRVCFCHAGLYLLHGCVDTIHSFTLCTYLTCWAYLCVYSAQATMEGRVPVFAFGCGQCVSTYKPPHQRTLHRLTCSSLLHLTVTITLSLQPKHVMTMTLWWLKGRRVPTTCQSEQINVPTTWVIYIHTRAHTHTQKNSPFKLRFPGAANFCQ